MNLDCMTRAELEGVSADSHSPGLRDYASRKLAAMSARLSGDIRKAMAHEARCDVLYAALPAEERW